MNHNLDKLKVSYKVFKKGVCERIDRKTEEMANEQGLEFIGSGYNIKTNERDISFESSTYKKVKDSQ